MCFIHIKLHLYKPSSEVLFVNLWKRLWNDENNFTENVKTFFELFQFLVQTFKTFFLPRM